MKVPIEWLKELVSFRASGDQLAGMLTMGGLETTLLPDDVLEVDVLPNRSDGWSVRGIAREISALTKFKIKSYKSKVKESFKGINKQVKVEVRDKDLCPRYLARVIENVKVGESPEWLKKRLEQAGLRPVNNVVDATNYILHEIGQPLHAFDASLIKDQTIIVRRANPGEKVVTLDGKEHVLNPDVLVIADPEKVIAIAGVMGCSNTEVGITAKKIILEAAFFNPISIHKTTKLLKTRSDSSVRFEHGVDWEAVPEALDRAAALIAELGRGEVLKGKVDILSKERKPKEIEFSIERTNRILGAEIPAGEMINILRRLGFTVKPGGRGKLKVKIPLFRAMDVEREIDLIEEIARIWGFNRIEAAMPDTTFEGKSADKRDLFAGGIRGILAGGGLTEIQSYTMLGPKDLEKCGLPIDQAVKISNPLTVEESVLRPYLLPGLLKTIVYNQNRQVENVLIFEIGKTFASQGEKQPAETWKLGGAAAGSPFMSAMDKGQVDFFYLKGILENLLAGLGIEAPKILETEHFLLQPGLAAQIEAVGIFGALHPDIQKNFEITRPVFFFELDLEKLLVLQPAARRCGPLPRFPAISRDISMFLPAGIENQSVLDEIAKTGGDLIEDVYPFDKFKDSIAYRIIYRHSERTLTEAEVNTKHQAIIQELIAKLAVKIR